MLSLRLFCVFPCLFLFGVEGSSQVYQIALGGDRSSSLYWMLNYEKKAVEFEVHAALPKSSWFAIGFSDYGDLNLGDYCVFWTDWKKRYHLQDVWTSSDGRISVDEVQNCDSFRYDANDEEVKFAFERKFDTCDPQDYVIEDGTTHIVWARGDGPLYRLEGVNVSSAVRSGFERTQLLKNENPPETHPPDTWTLEILANEVKVPADETTYWCHVHKLPDSLEKKHHVIQYEPVIVEGNEHLVHHMEVFHCEADAKEDIPDYVGSCFDERRPEKTQACKRVLAAWAMGAKAFSYPQEAGLPVGGPEFNRFVMLEVHYNNPERRTVDRQKRQRSSPDANPTKRVLPKDYWLREIVPNNNRFDNLPPTITEITTETAKRTYKSPPIFVSGVANITPLLTALDSIAKDGVDSSGIRFYLTPSLRKHDGGVMELGLEYTDKMVIPPGLPRFQLSGFCVTECTAVGLPEDGIVVFGSQLHTHLLGTQVHTKHVRNGVELPELNGDNHYSTHFQEIRRLKRSVRVLPGDALITTCTYDSRGRSNATLGGFAITDEMCVNYVHYYPKSDLEVCKSSIGYETLFGYFDYLRKYEYQNTGQEAISENYLAIDWNPLRVEVLNDLYARSGISMQCNRSSGERFPGDWEGLPTTKIYKPFKVPQKCRHHVNAL